MSEIDPRSPDSTTTPRRGMRWYWRMPLKLAFFAVVTHFVLFPNPVQYARHLRHISNFDRMIEPDAPELAAWDDDLAELRRHIKDKVKVQRDAGKPVRPAAAMQREVERFVYDKVKYEWDWNLWGSADYMPTVAEIFEKARENNGILREDCDGRAVIAASVMRRLGYQSRMVADLKHIWVVTPEGEWMGPGASKVVVATSQGTKVNVRNAITEAPASLAYGIAVFPLARELMIAAAAWLLLLHRGMPRWGMGVGALLLVQGLLFIRVEKSPPDPLTSIASNWPAWVGMAHLVTGLALLMWLSARARRRARLQIR